VAHLLLFFLALVEQVLATNSSWDKNVTIKPETNPYLRILAMIRFSLPEMQSNSDDFLPEHAGTVMRCTSCQAALRIPAAASHSQGLRPLPPPLPTPPARCRLLEQLDELEVVEPQTHRSRADGVLPIDEPRDENPRRGYAKPISLAARAPPGCPTSPGSRANR